MKKRMTLRGLMFLMLLLLVTDCGGIIHADSNTKIAVFQWSESLEIYSRSLDGFMAQLKEAGYIESNNLLVDFYQAHNDMKLAQSYTTEIKNNHYDLVLSLGTQSTEILQKNNVTKVPVVFTGVFDPLKAKLVDDLNGSGTNYTGTSHRQPFYRQFYNFSEIVPGVKRLGLIYVRGEPAPGYQIDEIEAEKTNLGITEVIPISVENADDATQAVQTLAGKVDAIYLPSDSMKDSSAVAESVANNALQYKIPVFSALADSVKSGSVISTSTNIYLLGKEAGKMAIRILNGADPGKLPVQVQYYPEIAVNRSFIDSLGRSVPDDLLTKVTGVAGRHVSFFSDETVENTKNKHFDLNHGSYEIRINGETVAGILQEINEVFTGIDNIHFNVVGGAKTSLTYHETKESLFTLVHHMVREAGYLDIKSDKIVTVYGDDAGNIMGDRNIAYIYKLKALPVDTAQQKVQAVIKNVEVNSIKENSTIIISGPFNQVKDAVSFIESADFEQPVVSIQLLIVQYRHGSEFKWGINISTGAPGTYMNRKYDPGNGDFFASITRLDTSFIYNLKALIEEGKAKVITNPQLAVRNGESASIELTQEKNIVMESGNVEAGVVTKELKPLTAGTSLKVTPTIMQDGLTLLTVNGSLAVFVESTVANQYITETNAVNTSVNVRDGETLIIGGLIKREETTDESGIPGLRKLFLIGNLFKSKHKKVEYVETVLYITPRIGRFSQSDLQLHNHLLDEMEAKSMKESKRQKIK